MHGDLLRGASRGAQLLFHPLKATPEFAVGLSQRGFGIERKIACDVHQDEEEVSDFAFQALAEVIADLGAGPIPPRPGREVGDRAREIL